MRGAFKIVVASWRRLRSSLQFVHGAHRSVRGTRAPRRRTVVRLPCVCDMRDLLDVVAKSCGGGNPSGRGVRLLQQACLAQRRPSRCAAWPSSDPPDRRRSRASACEATGSPVAMYNSMMVVNTSRSRGLSRKSGIFPALLNSWRPLCQIEPANSKSPSPIR